MLNVGMVDNIEFWQTIFEFRGPKHVFHSRICGDKIKDHIKRKVDTNRASILFLKFTKKNFENIYLLLDSPNFHPQLKKSKKEGKFNCNDVFRY